MYSSWHVKHKRHIFRGDYKYFRSSFLEKSIFKGKLTHHVYCKHHFTFLLNRQDKSWHIFSSLYRICVQTAFHVLDIESNGRANLSSCARAGHVFVLAFRGI